MKSLVFAAASLLSITSTLAAPTSEAATEILALEKRTSPVWTPGYKPYKYKISAPGQPYDQKYLCSKPSDNDNEPYHLGYSSEHQSDYEFYLEQGSHGEVYGHGKYEGGNSDNSGNNYNNGNGGNNGNSDGEKNKNKNKNENNNNKNDQNQYNHQSSEQICLAGPSYYENQEEGYRSICPVSSPESYSWPQGWGHEYKEYEVEPKYEQVEYKQIKKDFFKTKHYWQPPQGYKWVCFEDGKGGYDVKAWNGNHKHGKKEHHEKYYEIELECEPQYESWGFSWN